MRTADQEPRINRKTRIGGASSAVFKIKALGWRSRHTFEQALEKTVQWYVDNEWWWRKIKSGEYMEYYRRQYEGRELVGD